MTLASIFFHKPLQDLLRTRKRDQLQPINFKGAQTVKHLVESLGVPHTEVGKLQLGSNSIGFGCLVRSGDAVHVYPAIPEQDYLSGMFSNGFMTIPARFILDNHLGKLASDMRMLGFDANYSNAYQDQQLADLAVENNRILLTRDRQLLMRKLIRYGYLVHSLNPDQQLLEILERFNLAAEIKLFRRCMRCNNILEPVEKKEIESRLEPLTRKYFFDFKICPGCQQVYWRGSHVDRMEKRLTKILPQEDNDNL